MSRVSPPTRIGSAPSQPLLPRLGRVLGAGVAGAIVVTAIGLGVHQVAEGESWEISEVTVSNNHHASDAALRHLADIRVGTHLFAVDLDAAVAGVEEHPWVRRAEVHRHFPAAIEIIVEEYQPVMLLGLDTFWYLDRDGRPFRKAGTEDLDYPLLTGLDDRLVRERPAAARAIIDRGMAILEATRGRPDITPDRVSEVHFDTTTGFTLILRNGSRLLLGFGDPNESLDRLERLLASGLDLERPTKVDLAGRHVAIATPLDKPS